MTDAPPPSKQHLVQSKSIEQAVLLKKKPLFWRLYAFPFVPLYVAVLGFSMASTTNGFHREISIGLFCAVAFCNLLALLATFWSVQFYAFACFSKKQVLGEGNLTAADAIMIIPAKHKGKGEIVPIERKEGKQAVPFFSFQQNKFLWNQQEATFRKPEFPVHFPFAHYAKAKGLPSEEAASNELELYGWNRFHIPQPAFMELFQEHAVAPFFLFQVFCVGLWMLDEYWYYSLFTLVMLVVFECTVVQQRISSLGEFKTMSIPPFKMQVKRTSGWVECLSDAVVPGDLVQIALVEGNETVVPCDMLLLEGMCVMNEAMLSGEATPLQKECIKDRKQEEELCITKDKIHILFAGTKLVQVNAGEEGKNWALAYVLRTGFHTTQGKLVRTMIYNSEAVSANNLESFCFILLLLVFAIAASAYVWVEGMKNAERNKFKLLLECIIIITQVIPPELPMELSLAVNTSLLALSQFAIFCTEPFRIPFAGKIDVCCLDKTGTITEEKLNLQGIAGIEPAPEQLIEVQQVQQESLLVLGGCHSLIRVEGKLAGDPMEISAFSATNWDLLKTDVVFSNVSKQAIRIVKKFHFSSALRRMSTVCSHSNTNNSASEERFFVAVKGAPEAILPMLQEAPEWYEEVFLGYARQGCRVIALAIKHIPRLSSSALHAFERENAESKLKFVGFLVFHCPLKKDSVKAIRSLVESSHKVVMVTGDNSLTSIHVARVVGILPSQQAKCALLDCENDSLSVVSCQEDSETANQTPHQSQMNFQHNTQDLSQELVTSLAKFTDICITGPAWEFLVQQNLLEPLLPRISVFARASPLQKESLLCWYKEHSLYTLMCGDGTNDVGALKQAHVGVALLDGKPEDLEKIKKRHQLEALKKQQETMLAMKKKFSSKLGQEWSAEDSPVQQRLNALNSALNDDFLPAVRLGDASVAAPFTSKISTLESVCNIIRQGRCTLVTTLQMYKILALNSLISAYSLSVLHLDGIRYADVQSTIMGFLITFCFLFLSKAKPLHRLSPKRPQSNIFNVYILTSIMLQFVVNLGCLAAVKVIGRPYAQASSGGDSAFVPSMMNSLVYLISLAMQVCTFMVNYQGHPFRESLMENKPLRTCLFGVAAVAYALALEVFPDVNEYLQIVKFPLQVKWQLVLLMSGNYLVCFAVERGCQIAFANEDPSAFFKCRE